MTLSAPQAASSDLVRFDAYPVSDVLEKLLVWDRLLFFLGDLLRGFPCHLIAAHFRPDLIALFHTEYQRLDGDRCPGCAETQEQDKEEKEKQEDERILAIDLERFKVSIHIV